MICHLGYDYFTSEPDSNEDRTCNVCDTLCNVNRNELGYSSSIQAMAGKKHYRDVYRCPNNKYEWHEKAYQLLYFIKNCPSDSLNAIVRLELKTLLEKNK